MRAGRMSVDEQSRRSAHSRSEQSSSTDITNTKRSKGGSPCTDFSEVSWSRFRLLSLPGKWGRDGSDRTGNINRIAVLITFLLLHDAADSLKTRLRCSHVSKAVRKHFSALSSSPVKSSANKNKLSNCSRKTVQKSECVA